MKYALLFFFAAFALTGLAGNIHIEINIDVEGALFWLDKGKDPDAYNRLAPSQIEEFFSKATQKAKLYCRQALGTHAEIGKIKNWTSISALTMNRFAISHHSTLQCMRELNLDSYDPTIGNYLDHAHFVLANFSDRISSEINHQLVMSTLKILEQIGARALPLLWTLHVEQNKSNHATDKFLLTMQNIIKNSDESTLQELISMILHLDALPISTPSGYKNLLEQKSNLLRFGTWPLAIFWQSINRALDTTINSFITDDYIFCFERTGNISIIVTLLTGLDRWLFDRANEGRISDNIEKHIRNSVYEKLKAMRKSAKHICSIKEFSIVANRFKSFSYSTTTKSLICM